MIRKIEPPVDFLRSPGVVFLFGGCKADDCGMLSRPVLNPPVRNGMSVRLTDANNETCLALRDTDQYTFDASASRWVPHPQHKCWMSGLVIKMCAPDKLKTSFNVTITGHYFECSSSFFKVAMRQTKSPKCEFAGKYNICKWSGVVEYGGLTTCVAECLCEGDDCHHVTIHIPKLYAEWDICEIVVK
ncbi:hypothetical protein LSAT2_032899 [Lamellibrachia satsuma]|nr:hypothetical protein LSAT2_032899 [Lamellibrachia satsuma]